MVNDLLQFAKALPLVMPARVPGVIRVCRELGRGDSAATKAVAELALLICAADDLLDSAGVHVPDGLDLLRDVSAAMRGEPGVPLRVAASWPRHRDELVRLGVLLRTRSPRLAEQFFRTFDDVLDAMRAELAWKDGPSPSFDDYLQIARRSIAAPALEHFIATWQDISLDERGAAIMRETGMAIRLGNDLSDGGREAREGKINALTLVQREHGVPPAGARAILEALLAEHLARAKRLAHDFWSESVLAFTELLLVEYARNGDWQAGHSPHPSERSR